MKEKAYNHDDAKDGIQPILDTAQNFYSNLAEMEENNK